MLLSVPDLKLDHLLRLLLRLPLLQPHEMPRPLAAKLAERSRHCLRIRSDPRNGVTVPGLNPPAND